MDRWTDEQTDRQTFANLAQLKLRTEGENKHIYKVHTKQCGRFPNLL